jgi:FtsZ-binding cell division protein ZapB
MKYVKNISGRAALCLINGREYKLQPGTTIYPVPDDFKFDPRMFVEVPAPMQAKQTTQKNTEANEALALKEAIKVLTQEAKILRKEKDTLEKENKKLTAEKLDLEEKLDALSEQMEEKVQVVEVKPSKGKVLKLGTGE